MSGIALIIPGADFSQNNIGRVSFLQKGDVEEITINGNSRINSPTAQYSIAYTPSNTQQTNVTWSVESGEDYISIDNNGLVTVIQETLVPINVTIKAVSTFDHLVYASKTLELVYNSAEYVTYVNGKRESGNTSIATATNMATFANNSLLDWTQQDYKVTVDNIYKVYFCLVRSTDYRCGVRSSLYGEGEHYTSTILGALAEAANLSRSEYNTFALCVVDANYDSSTGQGADVNINDISEHVSIRRL